MLNVLLVEKDMKYCKKLINNITVENKNIRLCAIASNVEEISFAVSQHNIDIILMDLKFSDYNEIKNKKLISKEQLEDSTIMLLEQQDVSDILPSKNNYIIKSNNINEVSKSINKLVISRVSSQRFLKKDSQENIIKKKIKNELRYLGYNLSYNGTKYLIETIYLLYISKDYYDDNLEKDIYPIVAEKYGKTAHNVKCNIINATNMMTLECEEEKLLNYLYLCHFSKPGPKTIISAVLGKI